MVKFRYADGYMTHEVVRGTSRVYITCSPLVGSGCLELRVGNYEAESGCSRKVAAVIVSCVCGEGAVGLCCVAVLLGFREGHMALRGEERD